MPGLPEEGSCPLPIVNRGTFDSLRADISGARDLKSFVNIAEDRLISENHDIYAILGYFASLSGWSAEQVTAARESMSLTYEVLRRQAEADTLNKLLRDQEE